MKKIVLLGCLFVFVAAAIAQPYVGTGSNHGNKFEQLGYLIPDPNEYRTASGAPGPRYWQQRCDYVIDVRLDEADLKLYGKETVTYYNNSPDVLTYLWLQLDENEHDPNSDNNRFDESRMSNEMSAQGLNRLEPHKNLTGFGDKVTAVVDVNGVALKYTINQTMMRIELPTPMKPGARFSFKVEWNYAIPNRMTLGGRGGYEFFPGDGNHLFTIAQWFPRLCVYSDFQGWQNHQFTGRGEFALVFGNYNVRITVPSDHVVLGTGECQNYASVLSPAQLKRWEIAKNAKDVTEVVTLEEAQNAEKQKASTTKTWNFIAENVRDFAWTSSRKYIWDAMPTYVEGKKVMCMSGYPKEAYGLYRKYSTKVVAHTLKVYSKHTIPYPYPVAQSVEAANGMEYPMICFNYGRTEADGTYSEATKYGMIGVIVHEVGHNFFPMIVNSDERQWSWMDEGLNTFTQFLAEEEFDNNYPSGRGPAHKIVDYMKLPKEELEPIMTGSDNIVRFGPNAYSKPATALNILRETVMGRELFDYAYKEYARRWAFKHPTPGDFFRTMEDASAVDLDWFWRGWFFGIDPVDISLDDVKWYKLDNDKNAALFKGQDQRFVPIGKLRNAKDGSIKFATDADTTLRDFYYYNRDAQMSKDGNPRVDADAVAKWGDKNFYELTFSNKGGLVMPVIVEFTFSDGTKEVDRIPAQIWRKNENKVTKVFVKDKEVVSIVLDPMRETADIDEDNGRWPKMAMPTRFQIFKGGGGARGQSSGGNPMQKAQQKGK
jgi:hypothetical protein